MVKNLLIRIVLFFWPGPFEIELYTESNKQIAINEYGVSNKEFKRYPFGDELYFRRIKLNWKLKINYTNTLTTPFNKLTIKRTKVLKDCADKFNVR